MLTIRKASDRGHADHGWLKSHQKTFPDTEKHGRLRLVASPDGRDGSLTINTDASVYAGTFQAGQKDELALGDERHAWVQVAQGKVRVNGRELDTGDGVGLSGERQLRIEGIDKAKCWFSIWHDRRKDNRGHDRTISS